MARNRKHQTAAVRFGPALRAFVLCMLIGGSGVGYVWQKSQIDNLAKQIKQREQRLDELKLSNEKLRKQLAMLQSPPQLERRVRELNLGLVPAAPMQVMRLVEPAPEPAVLEPAHETQYAARQGTLAVP
jgi:cell division protein FtsB